MFDAVEQVKKIATQRLADCKTTEAAIVLANISDNDVGEIVATMVKAAKDGDVEAAKCALDWFCKSRVTVALAAPQN